jgi:hypothetical protein
MDDVISQLMEQGQGSTAPPPASNDAMESLPKFKADKSLNDKECTVCKDGFNIGEDVTRLPCLHVLYLLLSSQLIKVIKTALYHGLKSMDHVLYVVILSTHPPKMDKFLLIIQDLLNLPQTLHNVNHPGHSEVFSISQIEGIQREMEMQVGILDRGEEGNQCLLRRTLINGLFCR